MSVKLENISTNERSAHLFQLVLVTQDQGALKSGVGVTLDSRLYATVLLLLVS